MNSNSASQLDGKKILLCVTGCVAIYKTGELLRKLIHQGADVRIVLSNSALQFVSPLFFSSLGASETYDDGDFYGKAQQVIHINLAKWCDIVLVHPATANTIGKLANGIFDSLLLTTIAALPSTKVVIAPAMNTYMLEEPAFVANMSKLAKMKYASGDCKYAILSSGFGDLACGDRGRGKIIESDAVLSEIIKILK